MIDTHAHLDFPEFDKDRERVISLALSQGIERIINIGVDLKSSQKSVELAEKYEEIYATVGVHPHDAAKLNPATLDQLEKLAKHEKVVAIGEIGLDFYRNLSPTEAQKKTFKDQINLALDLNLPIVVHIRDAHSEALSILKESGAQKVGGVLHCFSGTAKQAQEGLTLGFYLSFNGTLTYNKSRSAQTAKGVPLDFILTETDCPYLTPFPHRGKRNQPAYVNLVGRKLSEIFTPLTFEDIERITSLNAQRLFKLDLKSKPKIAYQIRDSLYLNITNQCTNFCSFCVRNHTDFVKGHNLRLNHEPSYEEIIQAIGDPAKYQEVVFCGYGEPTIRLEEIKNVAFWLKEKEMKVRLNTNGLGNLIHKRNIVPELMGLIDVVSISLNVDNSEKYDRLCKSQFGKGVFYQVIEFAIECKKHLPKTILTVLDMPEVDLNRCREIAKDLGVELRVRHYNAVG